MFPLDPIGDLLLAAPASAERVRYWDTAAAGPGKGDYTAGVLLARTDDGRWLSRMCGIWRPAAERNAIICQTAALDAQRGHVRTVIEQPPGIAKGEPTEAIVLALAGYAVAPTRCAATRSAAPSRWLRSGRPATCGCARRLDARLS